MNGLRLFGIRRHYLATYCGMGCVREGVTEFTYVLLVAWYAINSTRLEGWLPSHKKPAPKQDSINFMSSLKLIKNPYAMAFSLVATFLLWAAKVRFSVEPSYLVCDASKPKRIPCLLLLTAPDKSWLCTPYQCFSQLRAAAFDFVRIVGWCSGI